VSLFGRRVPDIDVDLHPAQDDAALRVAYDAARSGDGSPARDLLASVRHDHDRRAYYLEVLAESTTEQAGAQLVPGGGPGQVDTGATWIDRWAAAEPADPDALVLRARSLVARAWEVRGGGWASTVGDDAAGEFGRLLGLALEVNDRAAALAPDDPAPWSQRLLLMTALSADRGTFERGWAELVARDPWHREAHSYKLMYLCRKWHGSHDEMFAFARSTAAAAPNGSPLHVLPLEANAEWAMWEFRREGRLADLKKVGDVWRKHPGFHAELDNALNRWFRHPAGKHAMWFHDLNHLAYGLVRGRRKQDAKPVFEAIGPYQHSIPWAWWGDSVTADKAFRWARKDALRA
jgi:hypothetical protein